MPTLAPVKAKPICLEVKLTATAAHVLTAVGFFFIIDVHLHQPDKHPRQNTQEVQISSCLTHLAVKISKTQQ